METTETVNEAESIVAVGSTDWLDSDGHFRPNALQPEDIKKLEPWQLLVAACHFGPQMGDCRSLDYRYSFYEGQIYCGNVKLEDDIEIKKPMSALEKYAARGWKEIAERLLRESLCSAARPATPRTDALVNGMTVLAEDQPAFQKLIDHARELECEWIQRNQACDDYAATIYRQASEIEQLKAAAAQPNDPHKPCGD